MRRSVSLLSLSFVLSVCSVELGCGSAGPGGPAAAAATPPSPFVLQFVGEYATGASSVALHRDGTYDATLDGSGAEHGSYASEPGVRDLPLRLTFTSGSDSFTATIDSYDSPKLRVTLDDHSTESLDPKGTVGPDESLCDASNGRWTDDDRDDATGTYCVCRAPQVYIPSLGGCVD